MRERSGGLEVDVQCFEAWGKGSRRGRLSSIGLCIIDDCAQRRVHLDRNLRFVLAATGSQYLLM